MELSPANIAVGAMLLVGVIYAGTSFRRSRKAGIKKLAAGILSLRHAATRQLRSRPPGPADALKGDALKLYDDATQELKGIGFAMLGDHIEERDDGSPVGTARWFVDRSGEVCGWFAAIMAPATGKHRMVMLFFSELAGGVFVTTNRGSPELGIARSPDTHRQFVAWAEGPTAALDKHRSLMDSVRQERPGDYVRVNAMHDATEMLRRQREQTIQWRAQQSPEMLLEADVRNVLRQRYSQLGAELMAELRALSGK